MNPTPPANSQSVDPNLPGYVPIPPPNIAMTAPSSLPQTNQGSPAEPRPTGDYRMPSWPAILYITPAQLSMILTIIRAQGLWPAGAIVVNDADGWGLPPSMGDANFYSLYWYESLAPGQRSITKTDQLALTFYYYQDAAYAARRANNPPPRMKRTEDGSFEFGGPQ